MCACVCVSPMSYSHPPPNVTPRLYLPTHCYASKVLFNFIYG